MSMAWYGKAGRLKQIVTITAIFCYVQMTTGLVQAEGRGSPFSVRLFSSSADGLVKIDARFSLKCRLYGRPKAPVTFIWEKDGQNLLLNTRRLIVKRRPLSERVVYPKTRSDDAGSYSCMAVVNGNVYRSGIKRLFVKDSPLHSSDRSIPGHDDVYTGNICKSHMNNRMTIVNRPGSSQEDLERRLLGNMDLIRKVVLPECLQVTMRVLCLRTFPPRQTHFAALRLCREHCEKLTTSTCAPGLRLLKQLDVITWLLDDCKGLPIIDDPSNELCARIRLPATADVENGCREMVTPNAPSLDVVVLDSQSRNRCRTRRWHTTDPSATQFLTSLRCGLRLDGIGIGSQSESEDGTKCFSFPMPITSLLPDVQAAYFFPGVRLPLLAELRAEFTVSPAEQLNVFIGHAQTVLVGDRLAVKDVSFYLSLDRHETSIYGACVCKLCRSTFDVEIRKNPFGNVVLTGSSAEDVNVDTIFKAFYLHGLQFINGGMSQSLDLASMILANPRIQASARGQVTDFVGVYSTAGDATANAPVTNVAFHLADSGRYWLTVRVEEQPKRPVALSSFFREPHKSILQLMEDFLAFTKINIVLSSVGSKPSSANSLYYSNLRATIRGRPTKDGFHVRATGDIVTTTCVRNSTFGVYCDIVTAAIGDATNVEVVVNEDRNALLLSIRFNRIGNRRKESQDSKLRVFNLWRNIAKLKMFGENFRVKIQPAVDHKRSEQSRTSGLLKMNLKYDGKTVSMDIHTLVGDQHYVSKLRRMPLDTFLAAMRLLLSAHA